MKKLILSAFLFVLCVFVLSAQQTQTVKGTVIDRQSEIPLIGATIQWNGPDGVKGVVTDIDGYFRLEGIPVGRHEFRVDYLGYESFTVPNVVVTSGKEVVLDISLQESVNELTEVVVLANTLKDQAQNEMATVSTRQFSLEEVTRYSGGRSDVARLAANFAGVSAPDDSRNDIVIRGNAPTGVLWRIEGIPVPSPNHFGTLGTTGGPISALNPNMLKNSDFLTGAFPAEYGNANAGVFDIGFRNGNRDKTEFTLQLGALSGLEAMVEGPVGKNRGSYLVAGRYSFVGLVGAGSTSAVPDYQDISFKVDFGHGKAGRFTLFGIGGRSDIGFLGTEIDSTDLFAAEDEDAFAVGSFGVMGLKHNLIIGQNSYLRTVIGGAVRTNGFEVDRYFDLGEDNERKLRITEVDNAENRLSISSYFNSKINSKLTLRTGILYEQASMDVFSRDRAETPDLNGDGEPDWFTNLDFNGSFSIYQPFVQSQIRFSETFSLNLGLHGQYASINEQFVTEPRLALTWQAQPNYKFTLGYGMHNQTAPLPILFLNEEVDGELVQTNKDLDFVRSQHYVLGYDHKLGKDWRLKAEVYYQDIDRAPVERFASSYSTLTEGADFDLSDDKVSLVNEGTGFNQGVELTLEKFYSGGYHGLLTTSFFQSKYTGSDGVERNTPFNNGYVVNLLGGKEWGIGKAKRNTFVFSTKLTASGGRYFTPVDLPASKEAGFEILREELAFSEQYDSYLRWDVRMGIKLNSAKRKLSHQFYVDILNVTDRANVFARRYNRLTGNVDQVDQTGFFPDFLYRLQF